MAPGACKWCFGVLISEKRVGVPTVLEVRAGWRKIAEYVGVGQALATAMAVLVLGCTNPADNWDIIGYVAATHQYDGVQGENLHQATFNEIKAEVTSNTYRKLTEGGLDNSPAIRTFSEDCCRKSGLAGTEHSILFSASALYLAHTCIRTKSSDILCTRDVHRKCYFCCAVCNPALFYFFPVDLA